MSIIYKTILFLWFVYLMCGFVHYLNIFPYTPFDDIEKDPVYNLITGGDTDTTSILDYFFTYDVAVPGVEEPYHVTSLFILSFCIGIGSVFSFLKADIRPLLIGLTFGALLTMINSSWSFVTKITSGYDSAVMVFITILGVGIFFIFAITIAEKVFGTGGEAHD